MKAKRKNKPRRIVDQSVVARATLRRRSCAACGGQGANGHHVLPKGHRPAGDDVEENIVTLCGTGTSGCHGAFHGNPYTVQVGNWALDVERRDSEWVRRRVGEHLLGQRWDVIEYVLQRLGDGPGRAFLDRFYFISDP